MKGENLMEVPETADDIRAAVSALRTPDVSKGVSFHTFSLPEDRCARLLIKNLGRRMHEDVVREELEALGICVQGVKQLRSGRRNQNPEKNRPVTPHLIVTVARGPEVSKVRSIAQLCGFRVTMETFTAPKESFQCKRCQRFGHTQRNCGYAPRCVACGEGQLSGECSTPKEQLKCCGCGGNNTANCRGCDKWKEAKAVLIKRATVGPVVRSGAPSGDVRKAPTRPQPSDEQLSLGDGWNHVLRGARVAQAQPAPPPKPTPTEITEAPKKAPVTSTSKKARSKKSALKVSAAPETALTKKASTTQCVAKPTSPQQLVPSPAVNPSLLDEISNLLDTLPIDAYVELTRRLLTAVPSLPSGPARLQAVQKIVLLFVAECGSTA
jgi:hypothetical protein